MRFGIGIFLSTFVGINIANAQIGAHGFVPSRPAEMSHPPALDPADAHWASDLIKAIRRKDDATVRKMILERAHRDGITLDEKDKKDSYALARTKFFRYVNFLIDGETPLMAAINSGHPSLVIFLLRLGGDPNATLMGGRTPLMQSHFAQNLEIAKGYREGERDAQLKQRQREARQKYNVSEANLRAFGAKETQKLPKIEVTKPTERLRDVLKAIELGASPTQVRLTFFSGARGQFISFREKELLETYLGWLGPKYHEDFWESSRGLGAIDYVRPQVSIQPSGK